MAKRLKNDSPIAISVASGQFSAPIDVSGADALLIFMAGASATAAIQAVYYNAAGAQQNAPLNRGEAATTVAVTYTLSATITAYELKGPLPKHIRIGATGGTVTIVNITHVRGGIEF